MVRAAIRIVQTVPIWTETLSVRTAPAKIREFFKIAFRTRKQFPIRTLVPENPFFTRIRASKAYK
jgi:hypothetical protein